MALVGDGSSWMDGPLAGEAVLAQFRVPFCRLGRSILGRAAMKTLEVERPQKLKNFERAPSLSSIIDVG